MYLLATQIRVGMVLEIDGKLGKVIAFQHVMPGKGGAYIQVKLKDIQNKTIFEKRFRSEEKLLKAHLEEIPVQYLYEDDNGYWFMDLKTFEQYFLNKEDMDKKLAKFLTPDLKLKLNFYKNQPIGIILPKTVKLKVVETQPFIKKATASASYKPATLETGLVINVPMFIKVGDVIEIDTTNFEYVSRVQ